MNLPDRVSTPVGTEVQILVDALDPQGVSLASTTGGAAGSRVVAAFDSTSDGEFRFDVTSVSGTGKYKLEVFLNATTEVEPNDDVGSAYDLDDSFKLELASKCTVEESSLCGG